MKLAALVLAAFAAISTPAIAGNMLITPLGGGMTMITTPTTSMTCIELGGGMVSCN